VSGAFTQFEFSPRGQVYSVSGSTTTALTTDVVLTVTKGSYTNTVTINAMGRVRLN
jgi:hypothetical protein